MLSVSLAQTHEIAANLAAKLHKDIEAVALYGGLGAGKTAFTQGLVKALGYGGLVNSPTYAIVNEYPGNRPVLHFDWYRLSGCDELLDIGWHDYLQRGLCVVEWSERCPDALPDMTVRVYIEIAGENERDIRIEMPPRHGNCSVTFV